MANTYSQIFIHVTFHVKNTICLIEPEWETDLHKYITTIIQNKGQKVLAINGIHDHIHILIGMKPTCCLSDLMRDAKRSSVEFINSTFNTKRKFGWQEGFGAFSCGFRDRYNVINYILRQKTHHQKISFQEEYKQFLAKNGIDYKEQYLFEWLE